MELIEYKGKTIGALDKTNIGWFGMVLMPNEADDKEKSFKYKKEAEAFVKNEFKKASIKKTINMSTKKPTPKQLEARRKFAEMSKNGTLKKKREASAKNKGLRSPERNQARQRKTLATLETALKNAKTSTQKANLQELINQTKVGLNGAKTKGLTTLCARTVGVEGRRKSDGTQKKGYVAKKGGALVKKKPVKK